MSHISLFSEQTYTNRVGTYRMDLAYILVVIILILGCLLSLLRRIVLSLSFTESKNTLVKQVSAILRSGREARRDFVFFCFFFEKKRKRGFYAVCLEFL